MSDLLLFPTDVEAVEKAILKAAWEAVKAEYQAFRKGGEDGRIRLDLPIQAGRVRTHRIRTRKDTSRK